MEIVHYTIICMPMHVRNYIEATIYSYRFPVLTLCLEQKFCTISIIACHYYSLCMHGRDIETNNFVEQILCSQTVQSDARDLNMFRTHPSKLVLVPALVSIIASYEWTKVALMVENKQEYTPVRGINGHYSGMILVPILIATFACSSSLIQKGVTVCIRISILYRPAVHTNQWSL